MLQTTTTPTGSIAVIVPASDPAFRFVMPLDVDAEVAPFYLGMVAEFGDPDGLFAPNGTPVLVGEVLD